MSTVLPGRTDDDASCCVWQFGSSVACGGAISTCITVIDLYVCLTVGACHRYVFVDLAEASSRVLVDTALWFTVSEARDWSDSRAWPPFCLAR